MKCKARRSNEAWPDGDFCNKEVVSEETNEQRSGGSKKVSFMIILGKNSGQKERQIFRRASSFPEAGAGPRARHMIRTGSLRWQTCVLWALFSARRRGSGRGEAVTKLRAAKNETVVFVIIILVPTKKSARLLTDSWNNEQTLVSKHDTKYSLCKSSLEMSPNNWMPAAFSN